MGSQQKKGSGVFFEPIPLCSVGQGNLASLGAEKTICDRPENVLSNETKPYKEHRVKKFGLGTGDGRDDREEAV